MNQITDEGWRTATEIIDMEILREHYSSREGIDYPSRLLDECAFWGIPLHVADEVLSHNLPDRVDRMKAWKEHAERRYAKAVADNFGDVDQLHERMGETGIKPWMPKFSPTTVSTS